MWRWGDVAFYFGLLLFAVWKRPHSVRSTGSTESERGSEKHEAAERRR